MQQLPTACKAYAGTCRLSSTPSVHSDILPFRHCFRLQLCCVSACDAGSCLHQLDPVLHRLKQSTDCAIVPQFCRRPICKEFLLRVAPCLLYTAQKQACTLAENAAKGTLGMPEALSLSTLPA